MKGREIFIVYKMPFESNIGAERINTKNDFEASCIYKQMQKLTKKYIQTITEQKVGKI